MLPNDKEAHRKLFNRTQSGAEDEGQRQQKGKGPSSTPCLMSLIALTHYAIFAIYGVVIVTLIYIYTCADASNADSLNGKCTHLLTRTLPQTVQRVVKALFGEQVYTCLSKTHDYVVNKRNPILQIAYLLIINAAFIAWVFFGEPLLPTYLVKTPPYSKSEAYVGVFLCHYTWFLANTQEPGQVTEENFECFAASHEYDNVVYGKNTFCETCQVMKPARTKH